MEIHGEVSGCPRRALLRAAAVVCLMLMAGVLSSCLHFQAEEFSGSPDKILFNRAADAIDDQKYDVGRLMLETLINTYPDSEYAAKAKELLDDPRLGCGSSVVDFSLDCNGHPDSGGGLPFFPN